MSQKVNEVREIREKQTKTYRALYIAGKNFLEKAGNFSKERVNISSKNVDDLFHATKTELLLVGTGVEYLLKASFIKKGYHIHKIDNTKPVLINFKKEDLDNYFDEKTLNVSCLIENSKLIFPNESTQTLEKIKDGLHKIRKWRNNIAHFGMNHSENREDRSKIKYSIKKLIELLNDLRDSKQLYVTVYTDLKLPISQVRINDVTIQDCETYDEIEFYKFDAGAYFGYLERLGEKIDKDTEEEIIEYLKEKMAKEGYKHIKNAEFEVRNPEEIY